MGTIKGGKILPKILTRRHDRVKAAIQTLPVAIWYSITVLMGLPSGGRSPETAKPPNPSPLRNWSNTPVGYLPP
jgi:hypothetical protein